jgi:hypothetical protein
MFVGQEPPVYFIEIVVMVILILRSSLCAMWASAEWAN